MDENNANLAPGNDTPDIPEPQNPVSLEEMRRILEQEHGVVFEDKVVPEVPEIKQEKLNTLFPSEYREPAEEQIRILQFFVREGRIITTPKFDAMPKGDTARRAWALEMEREYGQAFREVYYNRNQLRKTNIATVAQALVLLEEWMTEPGSQEEAKKLKELVKPLWYKITGENLDNPGKKMDREYNELSLAEKKQVVSDFEKGVLETLKIFS